LIQKEQNRSRNEALPLRYLSTVVDPSDQKSLFPAPDCSGTFTIHPSIEDGQIVVTVFVKTVTG
jgi:hypothetical protein